jgi:membrane-associated protease RseP (regulator of RpoE activity)
VLVETVLLYILGVLVLVIGVALSIGLHELGHLIPAKLFKVRVGQYMIGFGPTLFSRKRGETEYGVKAIPLGGYISMAGMYPPAREGDRPLTSGTDAFPAEREYEADVSGRRRGNFLQAMVQDARTASADAIPIGAEDRVFYKLPIWKRIVIMFAGPFMNVVIATVLFAIILVGIGAQISTPTVSSVSQCVQKATSAAKSCAPGDPASPAAAAGIQAGDTITAINGTSVTTWNEETRVIRGLAGKTVPIVLVRNGKTMTVTATIIKNQNYALDSKGNVRLDSAGKPTTLEVGFLGVAPGVAYQPQSPTTILPTVGSTIGADFGIIVTLPQRLVQVAQAAFGSQPRDPNGPVGVVGVGRLAGEAATLDEPWQSKVGLFLSILASLNIALFAFNMIPLLPLDGGHIIGAIWEGLRKTFNKVFKRKDPGPVDIARLVPLTYVVVLVLGAMSLLLVYADIVKPITLQ